MPGVRPDRFLEARTPRHAALSLVGEPVMYRKFSLHSQTLVLSNAILSIGLTSTHQKVHWSFDWETNLDIPGGKLNPLTKILIPPSHTPLFCLFFLTRQKSNAFEKFRPMPNFQSPWSTSHPWPNYTSQLTQGQRTLSNRSTDRCIATSGNVSCVVSTSFEIRNWGPSSDWHWWRMRTVKRLKPMPSLFDVVSPISSRWREYVSTLRTSGLRSSRPTVLGFGRLPIAAMRPRRIWRSRTHLSITRWWPLFKHCATSLTRLSPPPGSDTT